MTDKNTIGSFFVFGLSHSLEQKLSTVGTMDQIREQEGPGYCFNEQWEDDLAKHQHEIGLELSRAYTQAFEWEPNVIDKIKKKAFVHPLARLRCLFYVGEEPHFFDGHDKGYVPSPLFNMLSTVAANEAPTMPTTQEAPAFHKPYERQATIAAAHYSYRTKDQDPGQGNRRVPSLQVRGHWLQQAGFKIGQKIKIRVMDGCLVITLDDRSTEPTAA